MINLVKTILKFKSKHDALRFHLLAVSTEEGLKLSSGDIGVAIEIHVGGYTHGLFKTCVDKGFFKSEQTVRNSVAKLTKIGVLLKSRNDRKVDDKFLPGPGANDFIFNYQVSYDTKIV